MQFVLLYQKLFNRNSLYQKIKFKGFNMTTEIFSSQNSDNIHNIESEIKKEEHIPQTQENLPSENLEDKRKEVEEINAEVQQLQAKKEKLQQEIDEESIKGEQKNNPIIDLSSKKWQAEYEAVVGLKHRKPLPPNPGQDAAYARADEQFSVVISADGAGSSIVSDIGSQRVVAGVYRLVHTLYNSQFKALDEEKALIEDDIRRWALILTKHAKGILDDLALEYRRDAKDFRCTLLVGLVGKLHTFWFKIGDGAIVKEVISVNEKNESAYQLSMVGEVGKGEYANETIFISEQLEPKNVQYGSFANTNLTALFTMSDGAAGRFVSNDGKQVTPYLTVLAEELRKGDLKRYHLTKLFYSEAFLEGHDGDDCSIALIAR